MRSGCFSATTASASASERLRLSRLDTEHGAALAGEVGHRLHHGREAGKRPGARVVPVGEAAGDDRGVDPFQLTIAVPEDLRIREAPAGLEGVDLVAALRKT